MFFDRCEMEFDLSKENIQPLRGGRNASQLGAALQAQSDAEYQKELLQQKEEFKNIIRSYKGPDPLENWYNFISWVEQSYPKHGHEGKLIALLQDCLAKFEHETQYRQDRRLCKLFIKFIDLQQNPLELFHLLYQQGIGTECADVYRAWAYYYEAAGDFKQANAVFQRAFQANAQPMEELVAAHDNFTLAVGRHVLQGCADTDQLAEKRRALTSLRTYKQKHRTVVPSQRTGGNIAHSYPGTYRPSTSEGPPKSGPNAPIEVFQDTSEESQPGPSTSSAKRKSILDSASKRDTVHKENTLKAGPWNSVLPKKNIFPQNSNLNFTVHEDGSEGSSSPGIKQNPNFVSYSSETFADFITATCIPDPYDPTKIPQYNADEVYANNTEYSFEEIRSRRYFAERRRMKLTTPVGSVAGAVGGNGYETPVPLCSPYVTNIDPSLIRKSETPNMVLHGDQTPPLNSYQYLQPQTLASNQQHHQQQQQQVMYTQEQTSYATPLKMRLSDLKVSSPLNNDRGDHQAIKEIERRKSVSNLSHAFNSSTSSTSNSHQIANNTVETHHINSSKLPENTAEEVAKAVQSISSDCGLKIWLPEPNSPRVAVRNDNITVCTKEAMHEINNLWVDKDSAHYTIFDLPKRESLTNFQVHEDETETQNVMLQNNQPFPIYTDANHYENADYNNTHHPYKPPSYENDAQTGYKVTKNSGPFYNQSPYANHVENHLLTPTNSPMQINMNHPGLQEQQSHRLHMPYQGHVPPPTENYHQYVENPAMPIREGNFEETCSTQMFNYNINKASTPFNERKLHNDPNYEHISLYYNHPPNVSARQQLFPQYQEPAVLTQHMPSMAQNCEPSYHLQQQQPHSHPTETYYMQTIRPDDQKSLQKPDEKLSVILEETKDYRSSSSGSSREFGSSTPGNGFKSSYAISGAETLPVIKEVSHIGASRDTCGMEYEVSQAMLQLGQEIPQNFDIILNEGKEPEISYTENKRECEYIDNNQEMYIDQNSKHSTENMRVFSLSPPREDDPNNHEMMDWDELSMDYNQGCRVLSTMLASDKPINPFSPKVIDCLLKKARFPNVRHKDRFERVTHIPKPSVKDLVVFRNEKFLVEKILGKGTYGTVVKAVNQIDGRICALKFQKPVNYWEYYICREIQHRIKDSHMLLSYMDITKAYFTRNASLFVSEISKYGSLLNVANKVKEVTGKQLKEILIFHFVNEMVSIVTALHKCQIIHADIKPDNFLVMCMPPDSERLSLQLIDFGCSIDMTLFPSDMCFYKVITTEDFTCTEMRDGKPWTYQTDLFCLAATAYVLLLGEYMKLKKFGGMWTIPKRLPRYVSADTWNQFFLQMLNIENCDALPDLATIQAQFQSILSEKYSDLAAELRNVANIMNGR